MIEIDLIDILLILFLKKANYSSYINGVDLSKASMITIQFKNSC